MRRGLWLLLFILIVINCSVLAKNDVTVRVGYFPNITHAPAVIGMADGSFQKGLGKNVKIEPYLFNAGPSAMEALLAGQLDLVYVGPNPAVNCYIRSEGSALQIIAGCCSGGAGLVIRKDVQVQDPGDLHGKRIATPQLGNTQDVAFRNYLTDHGMKPSEQGGDVQVMPTSNSNMLLLFQRKEIDGAWTVEPWVSRLIVEGGGKLFVDERQLWDEGRFTTAVLVVSARFLKEHPDLVQKWVNTHVDLCQKINKQPDWAMPIVNKEIERVSGQSIPDEILKQAWGRLEITYLPLRSTLLKSADSAYDLGFLGTQKPNLTGIYNLTFLNKALKSRGLAAVK